MLINYQNLRYKNIKFAKKITQKKINCMEECGMIWLKRKNYNVCVIKNDLVT